MRKNLSWCQGIYIFQIGKKKYKILKRGYDIPKKFKNIMKPEKISTILCTGNLCSKEQYNFLKKISSQVYVSKGDYDDNKIGKDGPVLKEFEIIQLGKFKVGLSKF